MITLLSISVWFSADRTSNQSKLKKPYDWLQCGEEEIGWLNKLSRADTPRTTLANILFQRLVNVAVSYSYKVVIDVCVGKKIFTHIAATIILRGMKLQIIAKEFAELHEINYLVCTLVSKWNIAITEMNALCYWFLF